MKAVEGLNPIAKDSIIQKSKGNKVTLVCIVFAAVPFCCNRFFLSDFKHCQNGNEELESNKILISASNAHGKSPLAWRFLYKLTVLH